jgi:hypothetical protein
VRSSKTPARYISVGVLDVRRGESPLQLRHHLGRWFVAAVVRPLSDVPIPTTGASEHCELYPRFARQPRARSSKRAKLCLFVNCT